MNSQLGIRTEINVNNDNAFKLENKYISINENNFSDKYENGKVVEKDFKKDFYYSEKVCNIAAGKDNNDKNEKKAYKPIINTIQLGLRTEINVNYEKTIEPENE
ncbi:hypothetical protein C1645_261623 [Glomus cerebriforme]|uniref:Uncharacterized protein n=1 Tax=Glomus cerebriforme TaxID=658196 RepID=A0A397SYH2_9GLOM|nr:hypothetical protein C1645_261623 [Glomus cerebriforme]